MSIFDDYVAKCRALVISLDGMLPKAEIAEADHLIDHGEAPEGMRILAWAIVNGKVMVDPDIVEKIREYASDIIHEADMPPDLDAFISNR